VNDTEAWDEFVSRFRRTIAVSVLRTASHWGEIHAHEVDDLIQDAFVKVCADRCKSLIEFSAKHPEAVVAYIKTIAINVTRDHFRSRHSKRRGAGQKQDSLDDAETKIEMGSASSQNATERQILLQQVNRHLTACSAGPDQDRDCLIFWLYYQQGMSAKAIAQLPTIGLTAKGVESTLLRLTRLLREQLMSGRPETIERLKKGFCPAESY
jgi:RNA polymerase sigma-70 factor, ECF subfamily